LPTAPWQALAGGAAQRVELIAGHHRDEFQLMMVLSGQLGKISDDQARVRSALAPASVGGGAAFTGFSCAMAALLHSWTVECSKKALDLSVAGTL
jgi:para-nitrobenzyl esterase